MIPFKVLACRYFPDVTPNSASRSLTCWISEFPELKSELLRAGFRKGQRTLSPLQQGIIAKHLGLPL